VHSAHEPWTGIPIGLRWSRGQVGQRTGAPALGRLRPWKLVARSPRASGRRGEPDGELTLGREAVRRASHGED
jgi:hypothetical protein